MNISLNDVLQIISIIVAIVGIACTCAYVIVKKKNNITIKGNKIKGNNNTVINNIGIDEQKVDSKLNEKLENIPNEVISDKEPKNQKNGDYWVKEY